VNSFRFGQLDFCRWRQKLEFVCARFSRQNSSGFNSAKASGHHRQHVPCNNDLWSTCDRSIPLEFDSQARGLCVVEMLHKNLKMFSQGLSCHIAECVLEPKS
jgi:hypothetical protein